MSHILHSTLNPKRLPQDVIFGTIFLLEVLMRMIALTPQGHFTEYWKIIDGFLTLGVFISAFIPDSNFASWFRIFRVVRLVQRISIMRQISEAFLVSLRAVADVLLALALLLFSFAVLGIELFSRARFGSSISRKLVILPYGSP